MAGYLIALAVVAITLYTIYRFLLLPQPIPGIPYNEPASRSIFGDLHAIARESKDSIFSWVVAEASKHPGPLFQFFLIPTAKPFVLLTDYHEAEDILMRRKEWDRSDWSIGLVGGQISNHHINMKTGTVWKAHRRLIQDLMTPSFLNNVAAPNVYHSALGLVHLWRKKARIANSRAFCAESDLCYSAMDALLDFGFGKSYEHRSLPSQQKVIKGISMGDSLSKDSDIIDFPKGPIHETLESMLQLVTAIKEVSASGVGSTLGWWFKNRQPIEKESHSIRDSFIKKQVLRSKDRLEKDESGVESMNSAIDLMVNRENRFAQKEGREPVFWSDSMRDEILGFMVAGHDSTGTTLLWMVKYLADFPEVQTKLRNALRSTHSDITGRLPTEQEISKAKCPYLEAFIEESLRVTPPIAILERQCNKDTIVLGHHLPKGTTLLIANSGAGITKPMRDIDQDMRSESSQLAAKERGIREWISHDPAAFFPERWLEKNSDADTEDLSFNPQAGPSLAFGLGPRSCFGRRLAYLNLRLLVTLLVWNFEFKPTPAHLSGYEPIDGFTRKPKNAYVRLVSLEQ